MRAERTTQVSRRGRRDNGLDAQSFVPLRDVDPRVGEHLLDVLAAAGIAAYLEPTSDTDSYTRAVSLPSPPSDRLWVDRAARPDATSLIAEHADDDPAPPPRSTRSGPPRDLDEDATWAQIVADYHRSSESPVPPWPTNEDRDDDADDGAGKDDQDKDAAGKERADSDRVAWADEVAEPSGRLRKRTPAVPDDPADHFVPPPPPPVPRLQQATLAALVCIAVGAMLLVAPGVLDLGVDVSFVLGVFAIVGGVGMLVFRMRERPPFDEGPDDGAVV